MAVAVLLCLLARGAPAAAAAAAGEGLRRLASGGSVLVIDPDTDGDKGCSDMGCNPISSYSDCAAAIDEANADLGVSNDYEPSDVDYSWMPSGCSAACFSSNSGRALGAKRARARSPSPGPRRYFCKYFNSDSNSIMGGDDGDYIFCRCADASAGPTALPTVTPLPTHVSYSTLVAHYSFDDGTAAEDGDGSLDGTIYGAVATTGYDGSGALAFDGTDDYVEFPAAVTADILGSNSRTVCLWANIDSFDGEGGLFDSGSHDILENFALRVHGTDGSLTAQFWTGDADVALSGSDDGDWHHYCLTYDGSAWALYFDGSHNSIPNVDASFATDSDSFASPDQRTTDIETVGEPDPAANSRAFAAARQSHRQAVSGADDEAHDYQPELVANRHRLL